MKKQEKFMVNPLMAGLFTPIATLMLVLTLVMLVRHDWLTTLIYGVVSAGLFTVAIYYGAIITVDELGVTRTTAFFRNETIPWTRVGEVGVCGTKVFNRHNPKRTGAIYLYISPTKMDDDDRFAMILKWPPKHIFVLRYSSPRLVAVQLRWSSRIVKYNVGKLIIEEQKKN